MSHDKGAIQIHITFTFPFKSECRTALCFQVNVRHGTDRQTDLQAECKTNSFWISYSHQFSFSYLLML